MGLDLEFGMTLGEPGGQGIGLLSGHVLAREERQRLAVAGDNRPQALGDVRDVVAYDLDLVVEDPDDLAGLDRARLALRVLDRGGDLTGADSRGSAGHVLHVGVQRRGRIERCLLYTSP